MVARGRRIKIARYGTAVALAALLTGDLHDPRRRGRRARR